MGNDQPRSMDEILTERELIELLGIKKSALDEYRYKHKLPFCKISRVNRIYFVADILNFIESKRTVLDKDAD